MSSPVAVMTVRCERLASMGRRAPDDSTVSGVCGTLTVNRPLTVPLLCSLCGCGFEVEGTDQVECGGAERHTTNTCPQINHVTFLGTSGVEAVEDVLFQVHAEGTAAAVAAVDRAGAAALRTAAAQPQAQMIGDLGHR